MTAARNLLIVSVDCLRFDALSAEPETRFLNARGRGLAARRRTPALDRLAREGLHFPAVFSSAPYTTNAHAGLFTGQSPWTHGLRGLWPSRPCAAPTLAEILKDRGFDTLSASGMPHLFHAPDTGLARGFGDRLDLSTHLLNARFPDMLKWLDGKRGGRFFAFFHSTTAHDYLGKARFERAAARGVKDPDAFYRDLRRAARPGPGQMRAYLDAVNFFDERELGPLLDFLESSGLARTTLLAVLGDHGEPHPYGLRDEELRVPVLFWGAGDFPRARRVEAPARLMDVFPTALALLGIEPPPGLAAAGLAPLWSGAAEDREIYAERCAARPKSGGREVFLGRALRRGARKVLREGRRWKAYDLAADPLERRARPASGAADAPLKARLAEIERADRAPAAAAPPADVVDRLRQLGYLD